MISREELIEALNEYDFTEEQISRIVKSKTVLKVGQIDKIRGNLNVLINNNIALEKISKCRSILLKSDTFEIEKIFKVLDAHNISK